MRRFTEASRLVQKPNDDAVSEESSAARDFSSATHLRNAVFPSANEHDALLHI